MRRVKKGVLLAAVVLGVGLLIGPVAAQEAPRADFASWGTVSETELDSYRAGDVQVLAHSDPVQTVNNTLTINGTLQAGTVLIDGSIIEGTMSIIAINTGNNVAQQNTINLAINMF